MQPLQFAKRILGAGIERVFALDTQSVVRFWLSDVRTAIMATDDSIQVDATALGRTCMALEFMQISDKNSSSSQDRNSSSRCKQFLDRWRNIPTSRLAVNCEAAASGSFHPKGTLYHDPGTSMRNSDHQVVIRP